MELRDKCFHSIHSYRFDSELEERIRAEELKDILMKMEMIFKSGYILSYNEILKLYGNVSKNKYARLNGDDLVSISLHKDSLEKVDLEYKKMCNEDYEDAYQSFVFQEPSIILSNKIMSELKHNKYPGIYLERFFYEPISLKYMEGISILPSSLTPFFDSVPKNQYNYFSNINSCRELNLEFLDSLKELMNKYKINVPIVSIINGNEYQDNIEYRKVLSKKSHI